MPGKEALKLSRINRTPSRLVENASDSSAVIVTAIACGGASEQRKSYADRSTSGRWSFSRQISIGFEMHFIFSV